ncbi:serine hydrolase [Streptomyces sp. TR02-1]|uniref:serine hydrolase n=1 Tax=Streptomyces sp. TR02-1 TaxID=3385977 RepID=UPI00399FEF28
MRRRRFIGAMGGLAVLPGSLPLAGPSAAAPGLPAAPDAPGAPTVTPEDLTFRPRTLRPGSPRRAGLLAEHVARIVPTAASFMEPGPGRSHPSHPGFVVLAARNGVIVEHAARGYALRYASWDAEAGAPVELPREEWVAARPDTLYDMASVSKLFTSVVLTILAERGDLALTAPVAHYLPDFDGTDADKSSIVVEQLLTHTSGMKAWISLAGHDSDAARMQAIYDQPLTFAPGTDYTYSDLNLITAGKVAEAITGKGLDTLVAELVTGPLGLRDTGYNPSAAELERIAATEYQPWTERGMVRGSVHDENAYYFGGVAGHAGIFSTAGDMAIFGQMVLNGGTYGGTRLLREETVRSLLTNRNPQFGGGAARGLGWQLNQRWYMDGLTSPVAFGHTGYTGTCLVGDPLSGTVYVLLTNRVHPTREWGTSSDYRRRPARHLGRALPVAPAVGRTAWFSGQEDATTATLRAPFRRPAERPASLDFRLWYDTESTDVCTVEAATVHNPGEEDWSPVPLRLRAGRHDWRTDGSVSGFSERQWLHAAGQLPTGTTAVRWRYAADSVYQGRGVYVDGIRVREGRVPLFLSERRSDDGRMVARGWVRSAD